MSPGTSWHQGGRRGSGSAAENLHQIHYQETETANWESCGLLNLPTLSDTKSSSKTILSSPPTVALSRDQVFKQEPKGAILIHHSTTAEPLATQSLPISENLIFPCQPITKAIFIFSELCYSTTSCLGTKFLFPISTATNHHKCVCLDHNKFYRLI